LVNHPGVILADEPKGNLDSGSGARVMDSLRELHRGVGIPVVLVLPTTSIWQAWLTAPSTSRTERSFRFSKV
jgi:putative ABC transport system ATP-binding protein